MNVTNMCIYYMRIVYNCYLQKKSQTLSRRAHLFQSGWVGVWSTPLNEFI